MSSLQLHRNTSRLWACLHKRALLVDHPNVQQLQFFRGAATSASSPVLLHHEWVKATTAESKNVVLFLHGLLGSGKNLRGLAKSFVERHENVQALLLDARGHGQSPSSSSSEDVETDAHTLDSAARDVLYTMQQLQCQPIGVVGHSFGGRVALQYLHLTSFYQQNMAPPRQTWMLDSLPGNAHSSVASVLQAVSEVPLPIASKKELVRYLTQEQGLDLGIAQWMTTNLINNPHNNENGFVFAFDLDLAQSLLQDFPRQNFGAMLMEIQDNLEKQQQGQQGSDDSVIAKVHMVRAGKNPAWTQTAQVLRDMATFQSLYSSGSSPGDKKEGGKRGLSFEMHLLPQAGHWVHIDDKEGLLKVMEDSFLGT